MSNRERGYWWITRPYGDEIVYWTGSEAQIFGSDATLSEREVTTWVQYIGTSPRQAQSTWTDHPKSMAEKKSQAEAVAALGAVLDEPPPMPPAVATLFSEAVANDRRLLLPDGAAFMDSGDDVIVAVYAAHGKTSAEARASFWNWLDRCAGPGSSTTTLDERSLPPGYQIHQDHEEADVQAWLKPWSGPWTSEPALAISNAWEHLRGLAKPLVDQAHAEWKARSERAGRYLTEVVNESNAAIEDAKLRAYHRVSCLLWPHGQRGSKKPEDVLQRVQELVELHGQANAPSNEALEEWQAWGLLHVGPTDACSDAEIREAIGRRLARKALEESHPEHEAKFKEGIAQAREAWLKEQSSIIGSVLDHVIEMISSGMREGYANGRRDAADAIRRALSAYTEAAENSPLVDAPQIVKAALRAAARIADCAETTTPEDT